MFDLDVQHVGATKVEAHTFSQRTPGAAGQADSPKAEAIIDAEVEAHILSQRTPGAAGETEAVVDAINHHPLDYSTVSHPERVSRPHALRHFR